MSMIINHNLSSLYTLNQMNINSTALNQALQKLSSGYRINSAADDAAGLSISEKMRGQISGLDKAKSNAQDGISLLQTAEGALNETTSILQRMRELSVQAANGTNTASDNQAMTDEFNQLKDEIDRIGNTTQFNTKNLLDGTLAGAAGGAVGANATTGAVVAKLAAGKMTAANSLAGNQSGATLGTDTLTIDGQKIDVNWDTLLTTAQKSAIQSDLTGAGQSTLNDIANTMVNAINTAIDNSGKNVAHITGYLNAGNNLVLQSGTTGTKSEVTVTAVAAATSIGATILSDTNGAVSAAANVGTSTYNGTSDAAKQFDVYMGGQLIGQSSALTITNGTAMSTTATAIQTSINSAITAYNTATGKTAGQDGYIQATTVTVSDDGRFVVNSPTGPITLQDQTGNTIMADAGLSAAQTSGGAGGGMTFQIGANASQTMSFGINDMRTAALGLSGVSIDTQAEASNAITAVDEATAKVSAERSKLGAIENRLGHTINNLQTSSQNMTAAESSIRDVDMASEMANYTRLNVLNQAATAMLAQANQQPQQVLTLLR